MNSYNMKHLMRYEGYSTQERMDDILDKIHKYGISSISKIEKEFLDSHSSGNEQEVHDRISKEESETIFEDDYGYFQFEYKETIKFGDEVHYIGVLYTPDLEFGNGKSLEGRLEGKIILYDNGQVSPEFDRKDKSGNTYDAFEFCNGLEYELDSFLDYVCSELKEKDNI